MVRSGPVPPVRRITPVVAILLTTLPVRAELPAPTPPPEPLNRIAGRVVDYEGQPVPGAKVALAHNEEGYLYYGGDADSLSAGGNDRRVLLFFTRRNGKASTEVTTDDVGRFEALNLREGNYDVIAVHPERGLTVVTGAASTGGDQELYLRLAPPTFLEGAFKGPQLPAPDASNSLFGIGGARHGSLRRTTIIEHERVWPFFYVKPDGTFRLGPLPADERGWRLTIEESVPALGFSAPLFELPVTLAPGETTRVELDLTGGAAIAGEVRGPDGEPLASVSVTARSIHPEAALRGALTDAAGKYVIRGLAPGDYTLEAKRWAKRTAPG